MNPDFLPFLVADDFAADALEVRKAVLSGGFKTEVGPDGALYTGISQYAVPHWFTQIEYYVGAPIIPRLSCFRINYVGEVPEVWVHSDDICAKWASLVYLNLPEQCSGGTAFWRHRALGMNHLPSREDLARRGVNPEEFYPFMEREWRKLDDWEQTALIPMRSNRFVTYPTSVFHSRFPFEGFGSTPADGRLIWVCFYDIQE